MDFLVFRSHADPRHYSCTAVAKENITISTMQSVLIIAEITTGKLVQKYLLHEYPTVILHHDTKLDSIPEGRFDIVVIDASRCPENIRGAFEYIAERTSCSHIILLRSMDSEDRESLTLPDHPHVGISWSSKPIKLAELAELLRGGAPSRPFR